MKIGVFHPGTQHSYQTAFAFMENKQLEWFATSIFYDPTKTPYKLERLFKGKLHASIHQKLSARHCPHLDTKYIRQIGYWEWVESLATGLRLFSLANRINLLGNIIFEKLVVKQIDREPVDVVWGYNSSSLSVFEYAKRKGIKCILDQTIGHPVSENKITFEEKEKYPDFFFKDSKPYSCTWINRQNKELELADIVVVGSESCRDDIVNNGCEKNKVKIINYGFDESIFPKTIPSKVRHKPKKVVDFLFVGRVHPIKGVTYLLEAFNKIPQDKARLTIAGPLYIPQKALDRYRHRVNYIGKVPKRRVADYFLNADCFILPSLFEGSAIVLSEALGAGLPIIQTKMAGRGATDGVTGYVLDSISVNDLVLAINKVAGNIKALENMRKNVLAIRNEHTWEKYRAKVRRLIDHD
jgi:glycosyltransferase involved in cell wall biosynthesis